MGTREAKKPLCHGRYGINHNICVLVQINMLTNSACVLLGALVTGAILGAGLFAYKSGNKNLSQHMMRARVVAQGVTVALMLGTSGAMVMGGEER